MFTPKDYDKAQVGNYMKFQEGPNMIRILREPITGYVVWEDADGDVVSKNAMAGKDGKPIRVRDYTEFDNAHRNEMKGFAAMVVWNYAVEKIQILEVKQSKVINGLEALANSKSWGDITGYDVIINKIKTGTDAKDVDYSVVPEPKGLPAKEILEAYEASNINLEALYDGKDPFEDLDVDKVASEMGTLEE